MDNLIDQCVAKLRALGADLRPGLMPGEIASVQDEFGFRFSTDHASLLTAALPIGDEWVDWRQSDRDDIQFRMDWPTYGVLSDVEHDAFWPASWGPQPDDSAAALVIARARMADVPTLVPISGHRYVPAAPTPHLAPVFSVYHTDVIYYGNNLLDYIAHEFTETGGRWTPSGQSPPIRFWSDLAKGAENADL